MQTVVPAREEAIIDPSNAIVRLPDLVLTTPILNSVAVFLLLFVTPPVRAAPTQPSVVPKALQLLFPLATLGPLVRLPVRRRIALPAEALLLIEITPQALPILLSNVLRSTPPETPVLAAINLSTAYTPGRTTLEFPYTLLIAIAPLLTLTRIVILPPPALAATTVPVVLALVLRELLSPGVTTPILPPTWLTGIRTLTIFAEVISISLVVILRTLVVVLVALP